MEPTSSHNKPEATPGIPSSQGLAQWSYGLRLQWGVENAYYSLVAWHPSYGMQTWDEYALRRDPGHVTAHYVASHLWIGATELMERTPGF